MAWKTKIPCACIPSADFVCRPCQEKGQEPAKEHEADPEPDLPGYGYTKADQDGFNGEKVSPIEHKEEEMMTAAKDLFEAKEAE